MRCQAVSRMSCLLLCQLLPARRGQSAKVPLLSMHPLSPQQPTRWPPPPAGCIQQEWIWRLSTDVEAERRLMYVAASRAKELLILTLPISYPHSFRPG